jgi:hypothetical protein
MENRDLATWKYWEILGLCMGIIWDYWDYMGLCMGLCMGL